jgi:hypothetical protein
MFGCHKRHAVAWYANPEGQRSHECERGTQECVRHNDSIFYEASAANYGIFSHPQETPKGLVLITLR